MKRLIFVTLAFLVGCNGMGSGANRFLPAGPGDGTPAVREAGSVSIADGMPASRRGAKTRVEVRMTIPKRHRREHTRFEHPSTISALTQSVSIAINGGGARVFNATPSSPNCSVGASGTVCTFAVSAPLGSDTFVIATYSGTSAGGSKLDQGSAVFNVVKGTNNTPVVRLGPVVSSTADSGVGSLRYALGAANSGDTIMLLLPAGSTIALSSPLTVSNRVSIAGPGVSASARHRDKVHADTSYAGVAISGNNAQQLFSIQAGATMTISGLILTKGNATVGPGGAITNAGTLTLVSDVLTGNTTTVVSPLSIHAPHARRAPKRAHAAPAAMRHPHCSPTYIIGGAVYNNATLIVSSTVFDGNVVSSTFGSCIYGYGGAVFNDVNGTFLSSGNLYTNNSAYDGGAVFNYSEYGQASFSSDTFDANLGCSANSGCPTSGCSASACSSAATGYGAAIYDDYGPGVNITGSVFENNMAGGNSAGSYGYGGALYLDEGSPSVTNSTFSSNVAGGGSSYESYGYAGAIYWCGSSSGMVLNNDKFTSNVAGGDYYGEGGAIESCEPFSGSNDTFTSNVALGSGSTQYTDAECEGGAIYQDDGLTLTNSSFTGNVCSSAYYSEGGALYSDDQSSFTNVTFSGNLADGTGATGVSAYAYAGAIYNSDGPLRLSNDAFTSNKATLEGSNEEEAYGGAIYNDGSGGMTSIHDTYSSNVASGASGSPDAYGGAICSEEPMSLTFDSFTGNVATSLDEAYGGAIYSDDSSTSITDTTFGGNSALSGYEGYGGAIYDNDGMTMGGDTLSGNAASQRGGGAYFDDTETVSNTLFTGNKITVGGYEDGGAGIYNEDDLTLNNSTISGNSVTASGLYAGGGGIYNDDDLYLTGDTLSGNAALGNLPSGSGGGGLFNYDYVYSTNSTITGNSSKSDGGGILSADDIYLYNNTVYQNSASGSGGNVSNTDAFYLGNSIVAGGTGSVGPDISNSGTLTSYDYNIIQTAVAGTAIAGTTTHNLQADPLLLALANNGGPTFTNADRTSSPGRADIPFAASECNGVSGTNVDQRGFARGAGGRCDVGAYEFAGVASASVHRQAIPHRHAQRRHPRNPRRPVPEAPAPARQ